MEKDKSNAGDRYIRAAAKQYLGDAVYFSFDGFHVVLTTSNGLQDTNRICLDPSVMEWLIIKYAALKVAIKDLTEGNKDGSGTGEVRSGGDGTASEAEGSGTDPDSGGRDQGGGV